MERYSRQRELEVGEQVSLLIMSVVADVNGSGVKTISLQHGTGTGHLELDTIHK